MVGTAEVVGGLAARPVLDAAHEPMVETHAFPAGGFLVCPPALSPWGRPAGDWAREVYRLASEQARAELTPSWYDRMRAASAN